jgi:hypothetical protein
LRLTTKSTKARKQINWLRISGKVMMLTLQTHWTGLRLSNLFKKLSKTWMNKI